MFVPWVKPKHRLMTDMNSDWSFDIKPHLFPAYGTIDLSKSLSRVHLHLPIWGFPTRRASLVSAWFRAGGFQEGAGDTSLSPVQERSDPGGLGTTASACHSTHGTRTQSP